METQTAAQLQPSFAFSCVQQTSSFSFHLSWGFISVIMLLFSPTICSQKLERTFPRGDRSMPIKLLPRVHLALFCCYPEPCLGWNDSFLSETECQFSGFGEQDSDRVCWPTSAIRRSVGPPPRKTVAIALMPFVDLAPLPSLGLNTRYSFWQ